MELWSLVKSVTSLVWHALLDNAATLFPAPAAFAMIAPPVEKDPSTPVILMSVWILGRASIEDAPIGQKESVLLKQDCVRISPPHALRVRSVGMASWTSVTGMSVKVSSERMRSVLSIHVFLDLVPVRQMRKNVRSDASYEANSCV
jgi:hypothetical protein